jgi:hypothetical protein
MLPVRKSRAALLTALGVDNFGSGLFLPVALVYVTRVVGLPLATAGTVVALVLVGGSVWVRAVSCWLIAVRSASSSPNLSMIRNGIHMHR